MVGKLQSAGGGTENNADIIFSVIIAVQEILDFIENLIEINKKIINIDWMKKLKKE